MKLVLLYQRNQKDLRTLKATLNLSSFNNSLVLGNPIRPNLDNLQPDALQQLAPMALGPFDPRQREKHVQVH